MRRTIIIGTALAVLVGSGAALAAATLNTYTGSYTFSPSKAGSAKKPVAVSWTETLTAQGLNGHNAAPLIDIKSTFYGVKFDTKDFPTCAASKIIANHSDSACPKGALVAAGSVIAQLGSPTLTGPTTPCAPLLHVWNAGGNKVNFFFVITAGHTCGSVQTGQVAPYPGTFTKQGSVEVLDTPLPPDVSTKAAGLPVYGSLVKEVLKWRKLTAKKGGKTVAFQSVVGCKAGKRAYSTKFTATNGTTSESVTVPGSATCS